jgi:hypothetical protein
MLCQLARKGWNVPKVEDQAVPQLDWLVHELIFRNHGPRHSIPGNPQVLPIYNSRNGPRSVLIWIGGVDGPSRR